MGYPFWYLRCGSQNGRVINTKATPKDGQRMTEFGTELPFQVTENLADDEHLIGGNRPNSDLQRKQKQRLQGGYVKILNLYADRWVMDSWTR